MLFTRSPSTSPSPSGTRAAIQRSSAGLQVDRAAGDDYHVWPAAAPAAWLTLSRAAAPG